MGFWCKEARPYGWLTLPCQKSSPQPSRGKARFVRRGEVLRLGLASMAGLADLAGLAGLAGLALADLAAWRTWQKVSL